MRSVVYVGGVFAMFLSFSAQADSFIRVRCDDKDVGAQVYINGKLMGTCPGDVLAPAGKVQLVARKIVNNDYEQIFSRQLDVIDGVPQRLELVMGPSQLTAEAKRRNEVSEANAQLRAAEGGNIAAMKKVADYYETGFGVGREPAKAAFWRGKAEEASAQEQLRAAGNGDIGAMDAIAARLESGSGIRKDAAQAQAWRQKSELAKREKQALDEAAAKERAEQKKAQLKQQKLDSISYTSSIDTAFKNEQKLPSTTITTLLPYATSFDLTTAPSKTSDAKKIQNEAALRPSTWGKPDSMMARASAQYQADTVAIAADQPTQMLAAK